jgi:lactoylglutathione lyase
MQLKYTILYVEDVRRALAFYEAAFAQKTAFLHEGGDYGELATGGTALAFSSRALITSLGKSPAAPDPAHPTCEIAFATDDVPAAVARAEAAGAKVVQTATEMPWGQTVAYVTDLDGFFVEICTPMGG